MVPPFLYNSNSISMQYIIPELNSVHLQSIIILLKIKQLLNFKYKTQHNINVFCAFLLSILNILCLA